MAYYNIFLSKREVVKRIEEIIDMEIVNKGVIKRGLDTTKYYIRIIYDDKSKIYLEKALIFFLFKKNINFL